MRNAVAILLLVSCAARADTAFDTAPYKQPGQFFSQVIQADDYPTLRAVEALQNSLGEHSSDALPCDSALQRIAANRSISKPTAALFAALKRLASDLAERHGCDGVHTSHFGTRAYKRRTLIEIAYGPEVLVLDAFSNGPKDPERLYRLDVVRRKDSLWWAR